MYRSSCGETWEPAPRRDRSGPRTWEVEERALGAAHRPIVLQLEPHAVPDQPSVPELNIENAMLFDDKKDLEKEQILYAF